jgi:hypothetical protein
MATTANPYLYRRVASAKEEFLIVAESIRLHHYLLSQISYKSSALVGAGIFGHLYGQTICARVLGKIFN